MLFLKKNHFIFEIWIEKAELWDLMRFYNVILEALSVLGTFWRAGGSGIRSHCRDADRKNNWRLSITAVLPQQHLNRSIYVLVPVKPDPCWHCLNVVTCLSTTACSKEAFMYTAVHAFWLVHKLGTSIIRVFAHVEDWNSCPQTFGVNVQV